MATKALKSSMKKTAAATPAAAAVTLPSPTPPTATAAPANTTTTPAPAKKDKKGSKAVGGASAATAATATNGSAKAVKKSDSKDAASSASSTTNTTNAPAKAAAKKEKKGKSGTPAASAAAAAARAKKAAASANANNSETKKSVTPATAANEDKWEKGTLTDDEHNEVKGRLRRAAFLFALRYVLGETELVDGADLGVTAIKTMAMGQAKKPDPRLAAGDDRTQWETKKATGGVATALEAMPWRAAWQAFATLMDVWTNKPETVPTDANQKPLFDAALVKQKRMEQDGMAAKRRRKWKRKKSTTKNAKMAAVIRSGGGTATPHTNTPQTTAAAALAVPASFVLREKRGAKRKDPAKGRPTKSGGGKDKKRSKGNSDAVNPDEVEFDNLDLREFDDV